MLYEEVRMVFALLMRWAVICQARELSEECLGKQECHLSTFIFKLSVYILSIFADRE